MCFQWTTDGETRNPWSSWQKLQSAITPPSRVDANVRHLSNIRLTEAAGRPQLMPCCTSNKTHYYNLCICIRSTWCQSQWHVCNSLGKLSERCRWHWILANRQRRQKMHALYMEAACLSEVGMDSLNAVSTRFTFGSKQTLVLELYSLRFLQV